MTTTIDEATTRWRSVFGGKAHAACDDHVGEAVRTVADRVVRVRPVDGQTDFKCSCGLSADWFLQEVEPVVDNGPLLRARSFGVALESDHEAVMRLLRRACLYLVSEGPADITALLEEAHAAGITDVYDADLACELCGNRAVDGTCETGDPYGPVQRRESGQVLCQPCEDGRAA